MRPRPHLALLGLGAKRVMGSGFLVLITYPAESTACDAIWMREVVAWASTYLDARVIIIARIGALFSTHL